MYQAELKQRIEAVDTTLVPATLRVVTQAGKKEHQVGYRFAFQMNMVCSQQTKFRDAIAL